MEVVRWAVVLADVKKRSRNGKLACAAALKLAKELKISPKRVGQAANELGIKIRACQLGCFK